MWLFRFSASMHGSSAHATKPQHVSLGKANPLQCGGHQAKVLSIHVWVIIPKCSVSICGPADRHQYATYVISHGRSASMFGSPAHDVQLQCVGHQPCVFNFNVWPVSPGCSASMCGPSDHTTELQHMSSAKADQLQCVGHQPMVLNLNVWVISQGCSV